MNVLAYILAKRIKERVSLATERQEGARLESRFIFHGPPGSLLESLFTELTRDGGISVRAASGETLILPVLLLVGREGASFANPDVGQSGRCDETHLLNLRNVPSSPSYLALIPPGQHTNRSISSTTDEFGIDSVTNSTQATFEEWWDDEFVQSLVTQALELLTLSAPQQAEASRIIESAAKAFDEVDAEKSSRSAIWKLISRLFSASQSTLDMTPGERVSLACGMPSTKSREIEGQGQRKVLEYIADAVSDGFSTGIDRATQNASSSREEAALGEFLVHIQTTCGVKTAFERAVAAFYAPASELDISSPPQWWRDLTTERWSELLSEEEDERTDLTVECVNSLVPHSRGVAALVWDEVELSLRGVSKTPGTPIEVILERTSGGPSTRDTSTVKVDVQSSYLDRAPPSHRAPLRYKIDAAGFKGSAIKVVSLNSWAPGVFVTSRLAKKVMPPKKPTGRSAKSGVEWETSLSVPGSGRFELAVYASPAVTLGKHAEGLRDDIDEGVESADILPIREVRSGEHLVEIEAEGKYQLDISFDRMLADGTIRGEICRVFVICEETSEVGCRSEFERLIRLNRRQLESLDGKSVVQLDRNARSSSLQSWMLDAETAGNSYLPLVLAEDYAAVWVPPQWGSTSGPILSQARFMHDPRPPTQDFVPPRGFVHARQELAKRIRGTDDQAGLMESAALGKWMAREPEFAELVETYLDSYATWMNSDPDIACWVDTILVTTTEAGGQTLSRQPDALILSPLHPVRLAWHCVAQRALFLAAESEAPCPAASVLDPDSVPDLLTLSMRAPDGVEASDFLAVECNSDYWSVLWNSSRLGQMASRSRLAPFDASFGITVGGLSSGFSAAQVARSIDDVSDLLAAKSIISLAVSSTGGTTDACNEGLIDWCTRRFGGERKVPAQAVGPRMVQIFDTRPSTVRPDEATIANLTEDTNNLVRWFEKQPQGAIPDLGIIAQLDTSEPELTRNATRSPLGTGALIRHRVRRQLPGSGRAFLSESRQGLPMPTSGEVLADKVLAGVLALENRREYRTGLRFAPNVHAINEMLENRSADFVAVSSASIDPACFLGNWLEGAYLWDYDLPSYSQRAGDTNGYYLLSKVREADRDGLQKVLSRLPGCEQLPNAQVEQILLEVARRGIPTLRGLSGDDTGATGDLGLFVAARLLQDQFRTQANANSLLPIMEGRGGDDVSIALIVPVDPFRGYLSDIARSLKREKRDGLLSRPDLLVVGITLSANEVKIKLTPVEVKCRQGSIFPKAEIADALSQAKSLSMILSGLTERAGDLLVWRLAYQHLLLSMIGFGLRVYSQQESLADHATKWSEYHERIAAAVLDPAGSVTVDQSGRLLVIDDSLHSDSSDSDGDGFEETIVVSMKDAARVAIGDAQPFYDGVREKVGDWAFMPMQAETVSVSTRHDAQPPGLSDLVPPPTPLVGADVPTPPLEIIPPTHPELLTSAVPSTPALVPGGVVLEVGTAADRFERSKVELNVSDTMLNQLNIGVVGDLGTGKTQLLKSLIYQIVRAKEQNRGVAPRMLIFDYKKDYSSEDFVKATGARVVRPHRLPLNLFDTRNMGSSPAPWLDRFRFFADVLDKIYSGIGPVQRDKLKGAVRAAYEHCSEQGRDPTIYDIHGAYRELLAGKSDSPMAIIDDLVDMEVFAREPGQTVGFNEFLDGVVVVSLDALGQDDRSKNMLVAVMLNMFFENMLTIPKQPFIGENPQTRAIDSYLLVDEADNIMRYEFDILRKLLLQGREFGVGVILASQYLRHFKVNATDYREPLLTWFVHKVPNVTSAELAALGLTDGLAELADRVKNLPNHHCLYKTHDSGGEVIRGRPFFEVLR
jgi:DNA phosphorothioation-dependent restriction protein DptH